jgi:hypothetical protein
MADDRDLEVRSWQAPPQAVAESDRLGWLNDTTEDGLAWLRAQRGVRDYNKAFNIISGQADSATTSGDYRSKLNTNRLKRNIREIVGTMAKLRPMWGYHSDNKAYQDQAEMMNKVTRAWYLESFADRKIKEALQYAAATCRGWCHPVYRREMYGTGKGDITLLTYGAPCILPTQLPASGDWQSAYAVTILDEMPVAMAHGMFPLFQHRLNPSSSRYWYANDGVRRAALGNIVQRIFNRVRPSNADPQLSNYLVPIRKTYIIDLTVNRTKQAIPMGEPGASWSYTVPYLGQDLPAGRDPQSGKQLYKKADENDARLYPHRRLILSTDNCIMYDGPAFDWHGMFPGISFTVDDWPWEPLGFSLVHDGWEIQDAINRIYRGNMDKINAQLDPAMTYDSNAVSSTDARRFDPLQPRGRMGYDGQAMEGSPMQPAVPPELLKVEPEHMAMIEALKQELDSQQAINDIQALAKMRAVGSMDDLEKVLEANGPIVEDMSRSMEPPMRDLGVMIKYLILQYYTTTRIMQVVGADGVSQEVFDYDPAKIIPSHIPGDDPDEGPSAKSPRDRARIFADNLRFFIMPNSLHEMQQTANRLALLMMKKSGVKMDSQTIAEAFNVPSYGSLNGSTVLERVEDEQERDLLFAARMKELAGAVSGEATGMPPGSPKPNGGAAEGRPPAFTANPSVATKDQGTRPTLKTSK